jgi:hypothetical protein
VEREKEIVSGEETVAGIPPVVVVKAVDVDVPAIAIPPIVVPVGVATEYVCAQGHPYHHPSNTLGVESNSKPTCSIVPRTNFFFFVFPTGHRKKILPP